MNVTLVTTDSSVVFGDILRYKERLASYQALMSVYEPLRIDYDTKLTRQFA